MKKKKKFDCDIYILMDEFDKLREEIEKLLTSQKTILLLVRHGETEANFTK